MGKLIRLIPNIQWFNGKIIKVSADRELVIIKNPMLTVIEGIAAFKTVSGITKPWLLDNHLARLQDSIKALGLKVTLDINALKQGVNNLIDQANQEEVYLQIIITPKDDSEFDQHILMEKYIFGPIIKKLGISLIERGYPHFHMQVKTLHNTQMKDICKLEADQKGVNDVLITDGGGYITGTATENIFVLKNGMLLTPPNDGSIVPGFTRQIIGQMLCNSNITFGIYQRSTIPVIEKKLTITDIYTADEIFLSSTKNGIVGVNEVEGHKFPTVYVKWFTEIYYKLVKEGIKL